MFRTGAEFFVHNAKASFWFRCPTTTYSSLLQLTAPTSGTGRHDKPTVEAALKAAPTDNKEREKTLEASFIANGCSGDKLATSGCKGPWLEPDLRDYGFRGWNHHCRRRTSTMWNAGKASSTTGVVQSYCRFLPSQSRRCIRDTPTSSSPSRMRKGLSRFEVLRFPSHQGAEETRFSP